MDKEPTFISKTENTSLDMKKVEEIVSNKIEQLKNLPLIIKAFEILDSLPTNLTYHNKAHTEDVLHETILFGIINGRSEEELKRNAIAASWHDVGFTIRPNENETIAVELFEQAIQENPTEYQEDIKTIILDTTVQKTEKGFEIKMSNKISEDVLDADVSNFGRTDFWEKRMAIVKERGINWENIRERREFLESTLKFIKNHTWHSEAAKKYRQEQKLKNIAEMERELEALT